jgi:hypothetical protein
MNSAVSSYHFDPARVGVPGSIISYVAVGFGPWIVSFGAGLAVSGISMLIAKPASEQIGVFWKRALAIAWVPALFIVYAGWQATHPSGIDPLLAGLRDIQTRYSEKNRTADQKWTSEAERIAGSDMLSASTLVSSAGIARNREKLGMLSRLLDQRVALARADSIGMRNEISALSAGRSVASEALSSVEHNSKQKEDLDAEIFDNHRHLLKVISDITEFLNSLNGRVVIADGLIGFENAEDQHRYQAYVQEAQSVVKAETELRTRVRQSQK